MNKENHEFEIKVGLEDVEKYGYEKGIKSFVKKFSKYKSELLNPQFNQSIDNFIYCYTKENNNCLIIQNKLGNSFESLSNIYNNVISQTSINDNLNFQKYRLKNINKKNIQIKLSDNNKFQYEDNYFDLIIFEGFENEIKDLEDDKIKDLLNKIRKILHPKGSFCFVTKNSKNNLEKIIEHSELKFEKFWSMQKNDIPSFSGKFDDKTGIKWCMKNLSLFTNAKKMSMKKKMGLLALKFGSKNENILKNRIVTSIVYRCYKEKSPGLIEFIEEETGFSNFIVQSRPKKIIIILLDKNGIAKKILNFKRYGFIFPEKIVKVKRTNSEMGDPNERLWIENWFSGRSIDIKNVNELKLIIKWLTEFQNKTKQGYMTNQNIDDEIFDLKDKMINDQLLNDKKYFSWIENYEKFLKQNKIPITAVHGDLWLNNIIFDDSKLLINVIDWEKFSNCGSALKDLIYFLTNFITKTKGSSLDIERFKKFLNEDSFEYKLIQKIKPEIYQCINVNINIFLLLKIEIIKRILAPPFGSSLVNKKSKEIQIEMLKILEEKQSLNL